MYFELLVQLRVGTTWQHPSYICRWILVGLYLLTRAAWSGYWLSVNEEGGYVVGSAALCAR